MLFRSTVKSFSIVNKAEVDVFLELSCLFDDPVDVGNLISGSPAFSKTSLTTRLADPTNTLHACREEQGLCPQSENPAFDAGLGFYGSGKTCPISHIIIGFY